MKISFHPSEWPETAGSFTTSREECEMAMYTITRRIVKDLTTKLSKNFASLFVYADTDSMCFRKPSTFHERILYWQLKRYIRDMATRWPTTITYGES